MLNTMTVTKTVAALCGALLVFLLASWAGRVLYATGPQAEETRTAEAPATEAAGGEPASESGEPAAAEEPAATVAEGEAGASEAEATAPAAGAAGDDAFAAAYAAADPSAGEKVFGKCKACHHLDGKNATGPHLDGVVGRPIATVEGFKYSKAMIAHEGASWEPATLSEFLTSPKTFAPGTKMSFAGLPKVEDRANLIAYLATQK